MPDAGARAPTPPDAGSKGQDPYWQVVQDHLPQLDSCYTSEVERSRTAGAGSVPSGTLKAQWTVLDGKVTTVKVLSQFSGASGRFVSCVTDAIRGWRFPKKRAGSAVMTYPFVFLPHAAARP